jgi:hypothetical protein
MEGNVLAGMGRVARARGDATRAHTLLAAALTALHDVGDVGAMPRVLYTRAALAADAGGFERAVRLAAAAAKLDEIVGSLEWPAVLRERDSWLGATRALPAPGPKARRRHWRRQSPMRWRRPLTLDPPADTGYV